MESLETEATLDQLLSEPITRLIMQRDGVSEEDIRRLAAEVAHARRKCGGRSEVAEQTGADIQCHNGRTAGRAQARRPPFTTNDLIRS